MNKPAVQGKINWSASVYYAEVNVKCSLEYAWKTLIDYQAWNPTFIGAEVTPVKGSYRTEGEVVRIHKSLSDIKGDPLPDFYAETVKLVPHKHITWYVYPEDESFRNFVDFGLTEVPGGVKFNIYYYEQNQLTGDLLSKQRNQNESGFQSLANAFRDYCESHA